MAQKCSVGEQPGYWESAQRGKLERTGWGAAGRDEEAPGTRAALLSQGAGEHGHQPAALWGPWARGGLRRVVGSWLWSMARCSPILLCAQAWVDLPGTQVGPRARVWEGLLRGPHDVRLDSTRADG